MPHAELVAANTCRSHRRYAETIANFESGARTSHPRNLAANRAALEAARAIFIDGDATTGPGVQLRDPKKNSPPRLGGTGLRRKPTAWRSACRLNADPEQPGFELRFVAMSGH